MGSGVCCEADENKTRESKKRELIKLKKKKSEIRKKPAKARNLNPTELRHRNIRRIDVQPTVSLANSTRTQNREVVGDPVVHENHHKKENKKKRVFSEEELKKKKERKERRRKRKEEEKRLIFFSLFCQDILHPEHGNFNNEELTTEENLLGHVLHILHQYPSSLKRVKFLTHSLSLFEKNVVGLEKDIEKKEKVLELRKILEYLLIELLLCEITSDDGFVIRRHSIIDFFDQIYQSITLNEFREAEYLIEVLNVGITKKHEEFAPFGELFFKKLHQEMKKIIQPEGHNIKFSFPINYLRILEICTRFKSLRKVIISMKNFRAPTTTTHPLHDIEYGTFLGPFFSVTSMSKKIMKSFNLYRHVRNFGLNKNSTDMLEQWLETYRRLLLRMCLNFVNEGDTEAFGILLTWFERVYDSIRRSKKYWIEKRKITQRRSELESVRRGVNLDGLQLGEETEDMMRRWRNNLRRQEEELQPLKVHNVVSRHFELNLSLVFLSMTSEMIEKKKGRFLFDLIDHLAGYEDLRKDFVSITGLTEDVRRHFESQNIRPPKEMRNSFTRIFYLSMYMIHYTIVKQIQQFREETEDPRKVSQTHEVYKRLMSLPPNSRHGTEELFLNMFMRLAKRVEILGGKSISPKSRTFLIRTVSNCLFFFQSVLLHFRGVEHLGRAEQRNTSTTPSTPISSSSEEEEESEGEEVDDEDEEEIELNIILAEFTTTEGEKNRESQNRSIQIYQASGEGEEEEESDNNNNNNLKIPIKYSCFPDFFLTNYYEFFFLVEECESFETVFTKERMFFFQYFTFLLIGDPKYFKKIEESSLNRCLVRFCPHTSNKIMSSMLKDKIGEREFETIKRRNNRFYRRFLSLEFSKDRLIETLLRFFVNTGVQSSSTMNFQRNFRHKYQIRNSISIILQKFIESGSEDSSSNLYHDTLYKAYYRKFIRYINQSNLLRVRLINILLNETKLHLKKIFEGERERNREGDQLFEQKLRWGVFLQLQSFPGYIRNRLLSYYKDVQSMTTLIFTLKFEDLMSRLALLHEIANRTDDLDSMLLLLAAQLIHYCLQKIQETSRSVDELRVGIVRDELLFVISGLILGFARFEEDFFSALVNGCRGFSVEIYVVLRDVLRRYSQVGGVWMRDQAHMRRRRERVEKFSKFLKELERYENIDVDVRMEDIPDEFICKLTFEIMKDPVILPLSKSVVERSAILRCLAVKPEDPFTRTPLRESQLIPHTQLKRRIEEFRRKVAENTSIVVRKRRD